MSKFAGLGVAVDAPARMTILHPTTGQPLRNAATGEAAWISLLSADSAAARQHQREAQNRRLRARARSITAETLEADGTELLAVLTRDWSLVTLEGAPIDVPCTVENARELYGTPDLAFIRRQVDEFVADLGNFPGKTTSPS
jgi:acyl-CoA reductase-like NAD-dependent aldehyde dehydrogenase